MVRVANQRHENLVTLILGHEHLSNPQCTEFMQMFQTTASSHSVQVPAIQAEKLTLYHTRPLDIQRTTTTTNRQNQARYPVLTLQTPDSGQGWNKH